MQREAWEPYEIQKFHDSIIGVAEEQEAISEKRMAELKAGVEAVGLKFRKPKNPGQTRWDSQYDCMVSIRPYKDVITNLAMNNPEWENWGLSASQWKLLEGACETLKHIKDTNKALEGEKEPTMNYEL